MEEPHKNIPQVEIAGSCESCDGVIQKCELNEVNFKLCDKCGSQICEKCIVKCVTCKEKGCKKCFTEIDGDHVCDEDCRDGLLIIIAKEELITVAEERLAVIKKGFVGHPDKYARGILFGAEEIVNAIKGEE